MQATAAHEQLTASSSRVRELEWELQHVCGQHEQADQAQTATLRAAQDKAAASEHASNTAHQEAAALRSSSERLQAEAARLLRDLDEMKVPWLLQQSQPGFLDTDLHCSLLSTNVR